MLFGVCIALRSAVINVCMHVCVGITSLALMLRFINDLLVGCVFAHFREHASQSYLRPHVLRR